MRNAQSHYFFSKNILFRREYFGSILYNSKRDKICSLNKTGSDILYLIKVGAKTFDTIIKVLSSYYEITEDQIHNDVKDFITDHIKRGTIIEVNEKDSDESQLKYFIDSLSKSHEKSYPEYLISPLQVNIHPFYECNQKCIFCYATPSKHYDTLSEKIMSEVDVLTAIEKSIQAKVLYVGILGGEPLLNKNLLIKTLERAKDRITLGFTTNGTGDGGISVSFAEKLKALDVSEVRVSIEASTPDLHDKIVGLKNAFYMAEESIKNLVETGVTTLISCVAIKQNMHEIIQLLEKSIEWGTTGFHLLYLSPCGLASSNYWSMAIPPPNYSLVIKQLKEYREKYLDEFVVTYEAPFYFSKKKESLSSLTPFDKHIIGCAAGANQLELDPYGNVYGCAFNFGEKQFILGNIRHKDIGEMWENPKLDYFRKRELDELKSPECRECVHNFLCKGGCPLVAEKYLNDSFFGDPRCPVIYKKYFQRN